MADHSHHDHDHQKPINPFEHHHHHHHDDDDDPKQQVRDPAQESLADALRVSFSVLKIVIAILAVIYLGSGIFQVGSQEHVVRLRFGQIVGEGQERILGEGIHFGFPFPIEQRVSVPSTPRTIAIDDAFWYEVPEAQRGLTADEMAEQLGDRPLNPEKDGSLLTGDANIVHARWSVRYEIDDPVNFIEHIANPGKIEDMLAKADEVVRLAAERSIVQTAAQATADEILKRSLAEGGGLTGVSDSRTRINRALDELNSGITVMRVSIGTAAFPLSVMEAYRAVTNAENQRSQLLNEAREEAAKRLGEAAGQAYEPLMAMIREYEVAVDAAREDEANQILQRLYDSLESGRTPEPFGDVDIGGRAASVIAEAGAHRSEVVSRARAEAETFRSLLEAYQENPRVFLSRRFERMREKVFTSGDIETHYIPRGVELYLEANRDPAYRRDRETDQLRTEE